MKSIFINSTEGYSGKTFLCLGLCAKFKKENLRFGYFKPIGYLPKREGDIVTDSDALFMQKYFGLSDSISEICPGVITQDLIQEAYRGNATGLQDRIRNSFNTISKDKDIVVVGGAGNIFEGSFFGMNGLRLVEILNTEVIIVDKYQSEVQSIDNFLCIKEFLKDRLSGVVINSVASEKRGYVKERVVPFLEGKGIQVFGVIPEDKLLASISISKLVEVTGGKVVCCEDKLDDFIESFAIGAMGLEKAMGIFRKMRNMALITGGDRAELQIASLEASLKCMVLTGGLYPNEIIISRAVERGVPIIIASEDTFTVVGRLESSIGRLEIREEKKIERAIGIIEENFDFKRLYRKLKI